MNPVAFIGVFFIVMGVMALLLQRRRHRLADEAVAWPTTAGRVVASRVSAARKGKDEDDTFTFEYVYEVAGTCHVGRRIGCFGLEANMALKQMEELHARYPDGATVQIHYDPADPRRCTLEPGNREGENARRNIGVICMMFGAILSVLGLPSASLPL